MSKVWDEYIKLASNWEKGKKDSDYNVIPEKDSEKTGNELIEKAHSKQVQVANSMMNDGIVENGVESIKEMTEIALIPPRGFVGNVSNFNAIAEVVPLLTKIANKLDEVGNKETIKLASDIDLFLGKVAQMSSMDQNQSIDPGPTAQPEAPKLELSDPKQKPNKPEVKMMDVNSFLDKVGSFLSRLESLDFSKENESAKEDTDKLGAFLRKYQDDVKNAQGGDVKVKLTVQLSAAIRTVYDRIRSDIKQSDSHWYSNVGNATLKLWDDLKLQADDWISNFGESHLPTAPSGSSSVEKDIAKKNAPHGGGPARHQYLKSPTVHALQKAMGFAEAKDASPEQKKEDAIADSMLGPKTYGAMEQLAQSNKELAAILKEVGPLPKWDEKAVSRALSVLKPAEKAPAEVKSPQKDEVLNPYPEGYETGYNAGKTELERRWEKFFRSSSPYHQLEIHNGTIYPYGVAETQKNPKNFPSYQFNEDAINMLLGQR